MLRISEVETYLSSLFQEKVKVIKVGDMLASKGKDELKGFGYGSPLLVEFEIDGKKKKAVISTLRGDTFGHDFLADRASSQVLAFETFNQLPRHVRALDLGIITNKKRLISLGQAEEFFLLIDFVEGKEYFYDLEALKNKNLPDPLDKKRTKVLSDYLVEIHQVKKDEPSLYVRRARDLVGHGECIMGLIDNYPSNWSFLPSGYFKDLEKKCIDWRYKLKEMTHRLSQVHGDYHPWNILFYSDTDFWVLDRSRGEWGEPADDLTALSLNYLFFSLQAHQKVSEPFLSLFKLFWENYLEKTGDSEALKVCPPFFAWRGLVIASPIWYPNLSNTVRQKIFSFIQNVLNLEKFELSRVGEYFL